MFKVLWSIQGHKSQLLNTFYLIFGVWNIFHPPFIETQSFVFSAKSDTCHMGPAIEVNAFSPVCRPMFKVLWSTRGRKSQLLHALYLMFGVSCTESSTLSF